MKGDMGNGNQWIRTPMLRGPQSKRPIHHGQAVDQAKPQAARWQLEPIKTVEIKLDFSGLRKIQLRKRLQRLLRQLRRLPGPVVAGAGLVLLLWLLAFAGHQFWLARQAAKTVESSAGSAQRAGPTPGTPTYSTILPSGKGIQALGGWYLISPPGRDPVYAYADSIASTHIDVSEQPLPDSFKANTAAQLNQLALSFSVSQKLTAADGLTIYLGTSAKGPQSLIFTKDNLLILIKSTTVIANNQWIQYVNSLQ